MLLVLGSINIDLTTTTARIPGVGETVIGKSFATYAGGKGANQAVCAAKLKADVCFLGRVGSDGHGDFLLSEMAKAGVDVARIERSDASTGTAAISVDAAGQNSIIVVPGANFDIDTAYVDRHADAIKNCDILLAQQETPVAATEYAFRLAKSWNKTTILNPAPAEKISEEMLRATDILVPNEHELSHLTGVRCHSIESIAQAAQLLRAQGARAVIVTMGREGVFLADGKTEHVFPAFQTTAVDTTAAGDSFLGGFAVAYGKNRDMAAAIMYGQMVASYSIQHAGAQSSMPSYEQFTAYQKNFPL